MIFRKMLSKRDVLYQCQEPVGDVLPYGHAAGQRPTAQHAGSQHQVRFAGDDGCNHLRYQGRIILVIRVQHDHDIRVTAQCLNVAALLVTAVPLVLHVDHHVQTKLSGNLDRVVLADVIDQDNLIHHFMWDVAVRLLQCLGRVVGRHHHHNFQVFASLIPYRHEFILPLPGRYSIRPSTRSSRATSSTASTGLARASIHCTTFGDHCRRAR